MLERKITTTALEVGSIRDEDALLRAVRLAREEPSLTAADKHAIQQLANGVKEIVDLGESIRASYVEKLRSVDDPLMLKSLEK